MEGAVDPVVVALVVDGGGTIGAFIEGGGKREGGGDVEEEIGVGPVEGEVGVEVGTGILGTGGRLVKGLSGIVEVTSDPDTELDVGTPA